MKRLTSNEAVELCDKLLKELVEKFLDKGCNEKDAGQNTMDILMYSLALLCVKVVPKEKHDDFILEVMRCLNTVIKQGD